MLETFTSLGPFIFLASEFLETENDEPGPL
jgi:hypothetical protein